MLAAHNPDANGEIFNISRGEARSLINAIDIIRKHIGDLKLESEEIPSHLPKRGEL